MYNEFFEIAQKFTKRFHFKDRKVEENISSWLRFQEGCKEFSAVLCTFTE